MKKRKVNDIFLTIMSILTLLVAIVGATFAYFSARIISEEVVGLQAASLSLGLTDRLDGLKTKLIPATNEIALYAGTNVDWVNKKPITKKNAEGVEVTVNGNGECYDENMNEVCSIYEFTVGNSSLSIPMDISAKVIVSINQIQNLWFALYDESNTQVIAPTKIPTSPGGEVVLSGINQRLLASSLDVNNNKFDPNDPQTYTKIVDKTDPNNKDKDTNVRTYKMVMWVKEMGVDQTKEDASKIFIASIYVETANGGIAGTFTAGEN